MKPYLYRPLAAILLCIAFFGLAYANEPAPAQIVTYTDGITSRVEVSGGDVGYPGPSRVVVEYDELGMLVTTTTRILPVFDHETFLPVVQR